MDKLKINHKTFTKFKHKSVGFTLVELIIVITILAILATIAFISFKNYSSNARDGNRMTTLKNIETGLLLFQTKTSSLPSPENHINIIGSGSQILSKQGYIGKNITSQIRLSTEVFDPKDNTQYLYSTNGASTKYQLGTYLEEQNLVSYFPQTYANVDYSKRFFYTIGNPVGILLDEYNSPLSNTTDLILDDNNSLFKVHFSNDSSSGSVAGTGGSLIEKITEYQQNTSLPVMQNNCSFSGSTILHGSPITLYKLESIDKFDSLNTCENNSLERLCNNGVLSGGSEYTYSSCVKGEISNCSASGSYVYNGHTYNIPALNHNSSTGGLISASMSENNGTFLYTLNNISCNDGSLINPSESNSSRLEDCNSGYTQQDSSCNDINPPTGGSFTINNGATTGNSISVNLNITCPTDISYPIQIAYGNSINPTNWVNCTSGNISHSLTSGDGNKTVFVRFRDSAGNMTNEVSKSINLSTVVRGEQIYTTPGSYTWTVPTGVTSVSVVCIGAGGGVGNTPANTVASGGGGGALVYINNFLVTSGGSYNLVVGGGILGENGGASSFAGQMSAGGGSKGIVGANSIGGIGGIKSGGNGGGNGGNGGNGHSSNLNYSGGGGGAGGYAGNGGNGGSGTNGHQDGFNGAGGAGGGGTTGGGAGGGGGVGLYGQGTNGGGGIRATNNYTQGGFGGSNGTNGTYPSGGNYGGGGGMSGSVTMGGNGACRIVWPGNTRQFPSTDVGA